MLNNIIYLYTIALIIFSHAPAMGWLAMDGSYVKIGDSEQYSANGKIQLRPGMEAVGQFSKSSGKIARYKYVLDSEQNYWGIITEGRGFVYDDHKMVGWNLGLSWKGLQVHSGSFSEWASGIRATFFNAGSEYELDKSYMTMDLRIDYIIDRNGKERWDYSNEVKKYFKAIYLSGRVSHIRGVVRQALTTGVEF